MKVLIPLLLCSYLELSCAPPQPNVAEVRKTIEAMTMQSAQDLMAGNFDTTLVNYTEDAVSLPSGMPMSKGKAAIKASTLQMIAMGLKFSKVKFTTMDVHVSGSFAYEIGTYEMTVQLPNMPEENDFGKYVTIYEHAADGSWKIKVETWNSSKPPQMPGSQPGS